MDILQISSVQKRFGDHLVLEDLNLNVKEGSIFGFIGQNGAGKTTTMKMILGLLSIDSGSMTVCGERVKYGQNKTNPFIGYLPDVPEFYSYMKPTEYLKLCAEIKGLPKSNYHSRITELLEMVGLEQANKRIAGFSRGMKQRLGIAQALLNEPKLLICDEPTSALDPIGRKEILDILLKVKGKTTVIFSTHILSDVERICDEIAVLHAGKIALSGSITELKARHRQEGLIIEFASTADKLKFLSCDNVQKHRDGMTESELGLKLTTPNIQQFQNALLQCLIDQDILPTKMERIEPSIENLFMEVVS